MELEMRRTLAERCMGWTGTKSMTATWYAEDNDHLGYRIKDAEYETGPKDCLDWHPDTDWQQCGMVIERMQGRGWNSTADITATSGVQVVFWRIDEDGEAITHSVTADTFTEAVSLAAALALEATDEQS